MTLYRYRSTCNAIQRKKPQHHSSIKRENKRGTYIVCLSATIITWRSHLIDFHILYSVLVTLCLHVRNIHVVLSKKFAIGFFTILYKLKSLLHPLL